MRHRTNSSAGRAASSRAAKKIRPGQAAVRRLLWLLFVPLALPASAALAQQPLVIGVYTENPLSSPQQTGMLDRLIKAVFARLEIPIVLTPLPGERSMINANIGITDGDINRIGGLDRLYPNLIQVPESNMAYEFVAFTKLADLKIAGWDSLRPYATGIVTGWKILEEQVQSKLVTKVDNPRLLFTLLAKDRAEVVVYERLQGLSIIKELGLAGVRAVDPPLAVRDMFLYLNKKHAGLVPRVAAELRKMKEDGTYAAIMSQDTGR